jgi:hypothetical protein
MDLSPFLIVLRGRDDRGAGRGWRRCGRRCGVGIRVRISGWRVGGAAEDGHETGDDDEDWPAMTPGKDVEGVQQKEDADDGDPDGAAKGAEEAVAVDRGTVVRETGACVGHLADEEPDAEAYEEKGNDAVDGKAVEQTGVADQEEAAEADEPDGAGGKAVTR